MTGYAEFVTSPPERLQEDLDVSPKMKRLRQWCEDVNRTQAQVLYDFAFVDDSGFEKYGPKTFADILDGFREYK